MGELRNAYKILVGPRELKRALGRSERICDSNLKVDFVEVVREDMNWIFLAKSIVTCYATKDAVRIGNPFITKSSHVTTIIHNYFPTLC
jgi:hypothetical protein